MNETNRKRLLAVTAIVGAAIVFCLAMWYGLEGKNNHSGLTPASIEFVAYVPNVKDAFAPPMTFTGERDAKLRVSKDTVAAAAEVAKVRGKRWRFTATPID